SHTPEPASSQAIAIFHSYVQYLQATSKLEERFGNLQMRATKTGEFDSSLLKQRRSELINLRKQYFDAKTIRAFFSEEDGLEDYSLAMIEIEQDKNLSMEQKQQRKQDYMNALPDNADKQAMQKFTQQQADIAKLIEQTETLKKQGATAKQLYDMRVQLVGKEAADRLAIVDKEEADYEQRFLEYQRQKQAIIKQESDSNSNNKQATQQKIDKLEQSLFNEAERKRLAGYEAVYNSKNTRAQFGKEIILTN
ncbi:MAG: lipase chaperone, partial [Pseudomonadales bacterium]